MFVSLLFVKSMSTKFFVNALSTVMSGTLLSFTTSTIPRSPWSLLFHLSMCLLPSLLVAMMWKLTLLEKQLMQFKQIVKF